MPFHAPSARPGPNSLGALFWAFTALPLQGFGGVVAIVQRELVDQHQWLSEGQFNASIAIAQAAPGPKVLFVALVGWHVGLNSGGGLAAGWIGWGKAWPPVVIALLIASGWILTAAHGADLAHWPLWLLNAVVAVLV